MTARVWIAEFSSLGSVAPSGQAQIAVLPSVVNQATFDVTGGVQSSAVFNTSTRFIRVVCEVQCSIKSGATATTADILLPAFTPEYFGVAGGSFLSVIASP